MPFPAVPTRDVGDVGPDVSGTILKDFLVV
jgi:hypothetical protein